MVDDLALDEGEYLQEADRGDTCSSGASFIASVEGRIGGRECKLYDEDLMLS